MKNLNLSLKVQDFGVLAIMALLLFYTGLRANGLSFIIDESISFNMFATKSYMYIISYGFPSANNHMLNSVFLRLISQLFGTSELLLRLPSLISHMVYMTFTYLICRKVSKPIIAISCFILLNANPYLLEFFALARGYAMAIAFATASIYFIVNYFENTKMRNVVVSFVFAGLAVLSHFSLLMFFMALLLVVNIKWRIDDKKFILKNLLVKNRFIIAIIIVLAIILFEPLRKLIKNQEFYDGGTTGFWSDTVVSLINYTLYEKWYSFITDKTLKIFVAICSVSMLFYFIYLLYKRKMQTINSKFAFTFLILTFTVIVSVTQHYIINSNFLTDRMALFFIPLFFIPVIFLIDDQVKSTFGKILGYSFILITSITFFAHTINSLNLNSTRNWKYDSQTKQMVADLDSLRQQDKKDTVKLGVIWLFEPTVNFYRITHKLIWLDSIIEDRNPLIGTYDYLFVADSNLTKASSLNRHIVRHYTFSNTYLLK